MDGDCCCRGLLDVQRLLTPTERRLRRTNIGKGDPEAFPPGHLFGKVIYKSMMTFTEYMQLEEGVVSDKLTTWLTDTMRAGQLHRDEMVVALTTLKQSLASIFGNNPRPSDEQLRMARKCVYRDLPKIAAVIFSLIAPVPGVFAALMVMAVTFKKLFGISILPEHFDKIYLSNDTWMGRMAGGKLDDWNLKDYHQDDQTEIHRVLTTVDQMYPVAGPIVAGLTVGNEVSNQDSIGASVEDYQILPRIREFPLHGFTGKVSYRSASDYRHCEELAKRIWYSKQINPVIIVEEKGGPYILEGGHRVAALVDLKITSIPAMIVVDIDSFFD